MKTNVAVFFGCASVEHEVSIISAVQAMHAMDKSKYNIIPVYITKLGEMVTSAALFDMDKYKDLPALLKECRRVVISRENGETVMKEKEKGLFKKAEPVVINVAFPIVHGTNGEDGALQGYFELLNIPYVGCDIVASAVGIDKTIFKYTLAENGLPVLPCVSFYARRWIEDKQAISDRIAEKIGYPLIVKPVNLGSSVGISKVSSPGELESAVTLACSFAEKILVEKAIENLREINCSVLGDAYECEASVCEEPFMNAEILSYEDKYMSGGKSAKSSESSGGSKGMSSLSRKLPADLPSDKSDEIRALAKDAFMAMGGGGVCRIDFLMDTEDDNKVYINEINTIPGSLAFYLWEASGLRYNKLIDKLIELAFKRSRTRSNLMFTIETNILSGVGDFGTKGSKS